jgi:hypothetical protein
MAHQKFWSGTYSAPFFMPEYALLYASFIPFSLSPPKNYIHSARAQGFAQGKAAQA